ncbi:MAG: carbohydrate ABC transporter permease [Firmicutes bacterium]|nr:carbohydrate ABC transporter permease [Bacillota bacterium]
MASRAEAAGAAYPNKVRSHSIGERLVQGGLRIPLVLWAIAVLFPILWTILAGFKSNGDIYADPWGLPTTWNIQNFADAWTTGSIGHAFVNSAIVTVLGTLLTLLLAIPTSYALERVPFRGNRVLYNIYLAAMMIPQALGWIPLFMLLNTLHLLDSIWGLLLVYTATQIPFSIFILTGFMGTIPRELEEAAAVDGLSPLRTLWQVIAPLAMSGIITVAIMDAINYWNEYFMALIFLQSPEHYTLGVGINYLAETAQYTNAWGTLFAGLTIAIVPVIVLYAIFQRRITEGLTEGAVKG